MIQLSYIISEDRRVLTLHASEEDRQELRTMRDSDPDWGCCTMETEVCEHLLANSELHWLSAADTGDLTDAPILGILGSFDEEKTREQVGPHGAVHIGGDEGGAWYAPILERWGYEPYQVRSFLDDLVVSGCAEFKSSW
jgi:hypothetical protein